MKKVLFIICIITALMACRKTKTEPEGPTDVRIYNNTDQVFENVVVNTSGGEFNFGTVSSHTYTTYHRYTKAFPKADISLTISGITYSTPQQDYTYMQYMGQMKMTYKVYVKNQSLKELDTEVVPEGAL
jgi:hypothetical protein